MAESMNGQAFPNFSSYFSGMQASGCLNQNDTEIPNIEVVPAISRFSEKGVKNDTKILNIEAVPRHLHRFKN